MWGTAVVTDLYFFFFQAEDGIRDLTVTGVQTCALPIFYRLFYDGRASAYRGYLSFNGTKICSTYFSKMVCCQFDSGLSNLAIFKSNKRSEERRVGKECRSRWSPYH